MLEAYELAMRKSRSTEAADAARDIRERFGDIPRLTEEEIQIINSHRALEEKRLQRELERTQQQERVRQKALRRTERERKFRENQSRIFRERLTAPRIGIQEFPQETQEALEGEGYIIYTLNGVSRGVFKDRVRGPIFPVKSLRSQVAMRPDLIPDDFTASVDDWDAASEMYRSIPKKLRSVMGVEGKVSGITVTRGSEIDYLQLAFLHLLKTGEFLFGEGVYVRGSDGFVVGNQTEEGIEALARDPLKAIPYYVGNLELAPQPDPTRVFLVPIILPSPVQGIAYSQNLIKRI